MEKDSFFSRIRSYFKSKNDGRYLAFILAEINRHHPHVIKHLLHSALDVPKQSLNGLALVTEYPYMRGRFADLAVFPSADAREPIILIEIKYHDAFHSDQDRDYAAWASAAPGRQALLLSRATLEVPGMVNMTWTRAALEIRRIRKQSDLANALVEHLEEEGIVMQNVDPKALAGFLKRLLCAYHGAGSQSGNLDGPLEFSRLMRNVKLLSDRFNPLFKAAWNDAAREGDDGRANNANVDFDVVHYLKDKTLEKLVNVEKNRIHIFDSARNGGLVYVFARHAFGNGVGHLRICYGFEIKVKPGTENLVPTVKVMTWADGTHFRANPTRWDSTSYPKITSKAEASIDFLDRLVSNQVKGVLQDILLGELRPRQKAAIKKLRKSIDQRIQEQEKTPEELT